MEKECKSTREAKHLVKLIIALTLPLAGFVISKLTAPNRNPRSTTSSATSCQEEDDMTSSPASTSCRVFSDDDGRPRSLDLAPPHYKEQDRTETLGSSQIGAGFTEAFRMHRPDNWDEDSMFQHPEGADLGEEIEGLKRQVTCLEDWQRELETQFREYASAREEESWYQRLQIMYLGLKLESLETQNQKTDRTAAANHQTATAKLDKTRAELRLLEKKVKKICRSSRLHSTAIRGHDQALRHRETEMWKANEELRQAKQEIRVLGDQLQVDRKAAGRLLQMQTATHASTSKGEEEVMQGDKSMKFRLHEREFVDQQLQLFQHRWYADMEELIYLGWVGACMRHEMLMMSGEEKDDCDDGDEAEEERTKCIPVQESKDQLIMELPAAHCRAKECRVELHGSGGSSPAAEFAVANQMDIVASTQHTTATAKKPRLLLRKIKGWARHKGKDKAIAACCRKD